MKSVYLKFTLMSVLLGQIPLLACHWDDSAQTEPEKDACPSCVEPSSAVPGEDLIGLWEVKVDEEDWNAQGEEGDWDIDAEKVRLVLGFSESGRFGLFFENRQGQGCHLSLGQWMLYGTTLTLIAPEVEGGSQKMQYRLIPQANGGEMLVLTPLGDSEVLQGIRLEAGEGLDWESWPRCDDDDH